MFYPESLGKDAFSILTCAYLFSKRLGKQPPTSDVKNLFI